jgi:hypothetical protein
MNECVVRFGSWKITCNITADGALSGTFSIDKLQAIKLRHAPTNDSFPPNINNQPKS